MKEEAIIRWLLIICNTKRNGMLRLHHATSTFSFMIV